MDGHTDVWKDRRTDVITVYPTMNKVCGMYNKPTHNWEHPPSLFEAQGGNSLYFVWYRRAAGIAPIFQVIYTSIGHDFILNIHL